MPAQGGLDQACEPVGAARKHLAACSGFYNTKRSQHSHDGCTPDMVLLFRLFPWTLGDSASLPLHGFKLRKLRRTVGRSGHQRKRTAPQGGN